MYAHVCICTFQDVYVQALVGHHFHQLMVHMPMLFLLVSLGLLNEQQKESIFRTIRYAEACMTCSFIYMHLCIVQVDISQFLQ